MEPEAKPPPAGSALASVLGIPRIMHDLAEGDLSEEEAATVARWLVAAGDEEPSTEVVKRAASIAEPTHRAKAG